MNICWDISSFKFYILFRCIVINLLKWDKEFILWRNTIILYVLTKKYVNEIFTLIFETLYCKKSDLYIETNYIYHVINVCIFESFDILAVIFIVGYMNVFNKCFL